MSARKRGGSQQPNMGWKQQKQQNRKQQAAESQRETDAGARQEPGPEQTSPLADTRPAVDSKGASGKKEPVTISLAGGSEISDKSYATVAEDIMRRAEKQKFWGLTTTKLRGIYGLIVNTSLRIRSAEDFERHAGDVQYLRVRIAYEAGREESVKKFLEETHLMRYASALETVEQFRLYCRYAEALVAYFKFFGGKDK